MTTLECLARRYVLTVDAREAPIMLTLHTEAGPRHYPGRDLDDACRRALAATKEREVAP
jgi:hypothetical protein